LTLPMIAVKIQNSSPSGVQLTRAATPNALSAKHTAPQTNRMMIKVGSMWTWYPREVFHMREPVTVRRGQGFAGVDRLTTLDRLALCVWPLLVMTSVCAALVIIAERWPSEAEQYVTPVVMLGLLVTYGLITLLAPRGSLVLPSRHDG
jgi:hypothetical protein